MKSKSTIPQQSPEQIPGHAVQRLQRLMAELVRDQVELAARRPGAALNQQELREGQAAIDKTIESVRHLTAAIKAPKP